MRDAGELLEWAEVHGNCYGTPREPVEAALAAGRDMLFDIDWQGTQQLYQAMRRDIVSVFVLPPSAAELKTPAASGAPRTAPTSSRGRLRNAIEEIAHWTEYDYVLVNGDLDRSFAAAARDPGRRAAAERSAQAEHERLRREVCWRIFGRSRSDVSGRQHHAPDDLARRADRRARPARRRAGAR